MDHDMNAAPVKLTPLGVTVLALLREGDMHAYEMLRLMQQRQRDRVLGVTKGTLYHTVGRLERQNLIAEVGVDRDGNRPERTTYTLLERGQDAVLNWVHAELPGIESTCNFRVALVEAHNLPRAEVLALLTIRRHSLTTEYEEQQSGLDKARRHHVPEQFLLDAERETALLEAELGWLDRTLERMESAEIPWGAEGYLDPTRYRALRKSAQQ